MFGNQQALGQQNQIFNPPTFPGQFGGGGYPMRFSSNPGYNNFLMPSRQSPIFHNYSSGRGAGMTPGMTPGMGPGMNPGMFGVNQGWGPSSPMSAGGQGYQAPGYPPRAYGQQQQPFRQPLQQQMPPAQGYSTQVPVGETATWKPEKGGIKGFISNLMAKWKR